MARSLGLIAVLVGMLMVVEFASIADAKYKSYLRVYEEPGCHHRSEKYNSCGCHNLKFNGGFKYDYNEKHDGDSTMIVYKQPNCHGNGLVLPREDKNHCKPFPFKSVYIS
ncbi:hypothetical protein EJ110_NYTH52310 [Nymphaea thermarum]|nr:hypothetical protein EJ110_NYTH52310 [Nymphaea thermarum]